MKYDKAAKKNAKRPLKYKTLNYAKIIDNLKCMISGRKVEPDGNCRADDPGWSEEFRITKDSPDYKIASALDSGAYLNAVVGVISAGYGSKHDGDRFLIVIDDAEMDRLLKEGKIQRLGSYM